MVCGDDPSHPRSLDLNRVDAERGRVRTLRSDTASVRDSRSRTCSNPAASMIGLQAESDKTDYAPSAD